MSTPRLLIALSAFALPFSQRAVCLTPPDFTYQESTQVTGGSVMGLMKLAGTFSKQARQYNEAILTTVSVKGNRMIRIERDRTEIIDLDASTITLIDHIHKQYTVETFEEMRQQMEAAMAKAKAQQKGQPEPAPSTQPSNVDVKFNVKVRNTGAQREVAGLDAKESILTMTADATDKQSGQTGSFAITNDMYLAPDIPGYDEVREFYKRYAIKMGMMMSGAVNAQVMGMMQQAAASKGMADMVEQMSKLKGIPVLQIMRMGTTLDGTPLPAASEAPLPPPPPTPSAGDVAKQAAKNAVMNSIPFGGFGRKKKQEDPAPDANGPQSNSLVMVESNTQYTTFSKASVDSAIFLPPAGYKRVAPKQID